MREFDKVNGKKIDLNNKHHRDVVLQRNKELQHAVDNGLEPKYVQASICKIKVRITTEIYCLKCGDYVEAENHADFEDVPDELGDHVPDVKCHGCATRYTYHPSDGFFHLSFPKTKTPKKK